MKGSDIKLFRKANNMTQKELADILGITQAFVSNMEAGRDTIPEKYIRVILNIPNVDTSMLIDVKKEKTDQTEDFSEVKMPREVFNKIAQLIDTVQSQQKTIAEQHRSIDRLISRQQERPNALPADNAECADAK